MCKTSLISANTFSVYPDIIHVIVLSVDVSLDMFFINPKGNGVEMSFWNGCFASKVIGASVFFEKTSVMFNNSAS